MYMDSTQICGGMKIIFNAKTGSSGQITVTPIGGINCITLYGDNMHFQGYTETWDRYQDNALATATPGYRTSYT